MASRVFLMRTERALPGGSQQCEEKENAVLANGVQTEEGVMQR